MKNTAVVVPIYKEKLDPLEKLSLEHSYAVLCNHDFYFVHPESLNIDTYYKDNYYNGIFKSLDDKYFSDINGYNALLLSLFFYNIFIDYKFILILQPDAIIFSDDLTKWESSVYDYIGAPWEDGYAVEIELHCDNFKNNVNKKRITAKVGNGGLSFRKVTACINLLQEFPESVNYFLQSKINEDIFFSCLGAVSKSFVIPNEIAASMFSIDDNARYYYSINDEKLPMGSHGWWKREYCFWSQFVNVSNQENSRSASEYFALDRNNSSEVKNQARLNIVSCSQSAVGLMPSTQFKEIEFSSSNNYRATNPSITMHGDELWIVIRTLNYHYELESNLYYYLDGENNFKTKNYLLRLNSDFSIITSEEIFPPLDMPEPLNNACLGFEDSRLFQWRGEFWSISAVRELNSEGYYQQVLAKIARKEDGCLHYDNWHVIKPEFCGQMHQKNWMPKIFGDSLSFIYSTDPVRVIDTQGNLIINTDPPIAADSFRGGSQLIEFSDGWLACIHETHFFGTHCKRYLHRFVMYNSLGQLSEYSEPFYFLSLGVEFAAGIARNPRNDNILVSFGKNDSQSWIASFDPDEIRHMLKAVVKLSELTKNTQHLTWITSQTNRTLKDQHCIDAAIVLTSITKITTHIDSVKNWSNILALFHTFYNVDLVQPILDIGATEQCTYLPGLYLYGYRNLISIDIEELNPRIPNVITHLQCDCSATNFNDNFFGFINCSSVLQFGVDIDKFMSEVSRILILGGYIYVSVDYWQESIDTHGKEAFGVPIKIFTPPDIIRIVDTAEKCGLALTSDLDLSCDQSAIHWLGFDYTFMNLLFKKII